MLKIQGTTQGTMQQTTQEIMPKTATRNSEGDRCAVLRQLETALVARLQTSFLKNDPARFNALTDELKQVRGKIYQIDRRTRIAP